MFVIDSMRPHALRESLSAPILNPAKDTAIVENMRGRQANQAFNLSLRSVKYRITSKGFMTYIFRIVRGNA